MINNKFPEVIFSDIVNGFVFLDKAGHKVNNFNENRMVLLQKWVL